MVENDDYFLLPQLSLFDCVSELITYFSQSCTIKLQFNCLLAVLKVFALFFGGKGKAGMSQLAQNIFTPRRILLLT